MNQIYIQGQAYPCRITMGAMLRFKKETGRDVSTLGESGVEDLMMFLWCCLRSACQADGVEFNMSVMQLADVLQPSDIEGFYADVSDEQKKTTRSATPHTTATATTKKKA